MKGAALGSWIATALLGFSMLTVWLGRGGLRRSSASGHRLTPHLLSDHIIPAVSALILWIVFLVNGDVDLAWIAFGMLIVVGVVGFTNFLLWQRRRLGLLRATRSRWNVAADQVGDEHIPPEQHFPVAYVVLHGVLAVSTVALVFVAALNAS
jgi:hypothetical protein